MAAMHLELHVTSYDEWRDSFNLNQSMREQFSIQRVTILRPVDDDTTVFVIAEAESVDNIEGLLAGLRERVFTRGVFTEPPKVTITEVETITQG